MACLQEYHVLVRRRIPASVALFGLLALPVLLVSVAGAQGSMNSSGGHSSGAASPAVSFQTGGGPTNSNAGPSHPSAPGGVADDRAHHHHGSQGYGEYLLPDYSVPVSGAAESESPEAEEDNDAQYQGGPTIFDRRGLGAESYVPPVRNVPKPHAAQPAAVSGQAPEPTLLIFKDGHQLEVGNYAIVGPTLIDLTPGHSRRVALGELDLAATRRQNGDRGAMFEPPKAN